MLLLQLRVEGSDGLACFSILWLALIHYNSVICIVALVRPVCVCA